MISSYLQIVPKNIYNDIIVSKNCIGTGGRTDIYGSSYGGGSALIPWQIFLLKKNKKLGHKGIY